LICFICVGLGVGSSIGSANGDPRPAATAQQVEVLFLSSLDPDSSDIGALIDRTEAEIVAGNQPVHFSREYLDSASSLDDVHQKQTASYLVDKYRAHNFRLVIAIGEDALIFAERMRATLFPGGALSFFVANPHNELLWRNSQTATTGVIRKANYLPTLQMALQQNPGTSHVIVVAGSSDDEAFDVKIAREQYREYASKLRFDYVEDTELSNLESQLALASPDTIILLLDFETEPNGDRFNLARVMPSISRAANRPIYGVLASEVGKGAVGGSVAVLGEAGRALGHEGVRLLQGEKPENIPIITGDFQRYVVDWQQLHRWGIKEKALPPDSILLNRQYSAWALYRARMLGLVAVLLIETILIVLLFRNVSRRRRAQEALSQKEKELAEVLRLARVGNWLWDVKNDSFTWSEELYRIHGMDPNASPPSFTEFAHLFTDESWSRLSAAMNKALETGSMPGLELELTRANGSRHWVRSVGEVVRGSHGLVTHLRGTAQDITSRKCAETKLQESQARLAAIVDSAMDAIIAVDQDQRILLFNASAELMFGCSAEGAIGSSMERFIPESYRTEHKAHLRRFGETGVTNRAMGMPGVLWALRSNGEEFPIEASISQVEVAGGKLFTVIIRDITERLRSEEAVAESEKRFRLIANTAPVLIWTASPDTLRNYFNNPWLEFTGRNLKDELGTGWTQVVHGEDLQHCLETYTQYFGRRETFRMEYRLRRHDGEYRWLLDIGVPRFSNDGSFVGYVGCCIDISDQKEARTILSDLSGRLLRAGEEERARIACELHDDINQRLALLANRIQNSESGTADPLQKKELSETWRLTNEIATDIQHISHQLHPSKLQYLGLATTIRDLCREFSKQHRIAVECVLQDLPQELDENVSLSLFRVVQESLHNVAKHSRAQHATVRLTYRSGMIHLFISDDGVGFDPLHKPGDHGLGLISMRERMRSVGGEFSIWSKPFLGTQVAGDIPATAKSSLTTEAIEA
jgi:PAS domain S-box-containing protein